MQNGLFVIGEIRGIREFAFSWNDKTTGEVKTGTKHFLKVETETGDYEFQLGKDIDGRRADLLALKGRLCLVPVNIWKDQKGYVQSFYRGGDLPKVAPELNPKPAPSATVVGATAPATAPSATVVGATAPATAASATVVGATAPATAAK